MPLNSAKVVFRYLAAFQELGEDGKMLIIVRSTPMSAFQTR
jgi:hypothetical protein